MSYIDQKVYILGGILHIREPNKFANQLKNIFLFKIKFIYLNPKPIIMNLKHIKSDVYQFIAGDYLNVFLTEKELRTLIKDNDIAFVYKTPIGWFVDHDKGQLPFHHYLQMMSEGALDSLSIILQNQIYEHE